ncbi:MAG: hypothetical protein VYA86_00745 [Candidatus Thermoplasmatota archaeon]|nr:hypothetical protein [Candidatus Thermoplasmatota archaeon]
MLPGDADAGLPRPYGGGFDVEGGLGDIIEARLKNREKSRKFWGRLAGTWVLHAARTLTPYFLILSTIIVMAFPDDTDISMMALCAAFASFCFLMPSAASSHYMLRVGQDRLGKRRSGRGAQDTGAERILNALTEARLHEFMRMTNQLGFALLLWLSDLFPPGEETRGILLVSSILAASIALAHTMIIERKIPPYSSRLPFLAFHAPSQHESHLKDTLTEILMAHLDPESVERFRQWKGDLVEVLQPTITPSEATERILHLLHLEGQSMLERSHLLAEMEAIIKPERLEKFLFDNTHLDIHELSRLMGHTRAWQRGFFHLLDRLQFDLMDHTQSLAAQSWRMDSSLPMSCGESRGDLFVMVNNLGVEELPVELEVHIPDGQPSRQKFRLTPKSLEPPKEPLQLWAQGDFDTVSWQSKLVDAAHLLWLGIAWADEVEGRRPVGLTLRHIDGRTIRSDTLWTHVHPRSGRGESMRRRMEQARNLAQRWRSQALIRTE